MNKQLKIKILKCSEQPGEDWYKNLIGCKYKVKAYDTSFPNILVKTPDGIQSVLRKDVEFCE